MFQTLIQTRRSIRKFLPKPVEPDKIEQIIEAALRAPSSRNLKPWEFIVITDASLLTTLSRTREHGSDFLKDAPLGMVVLADPAKCDVWIEDASIASAFVLLAAHDLGLGACWIQIQERLHNETTTAEAYIRKALNIPAHLKVECMIAIGYPGETKASHRGNLPLEKVHRDGYGP